MGDGQDSKNEQKVYSKNPQNAGFNFLSWCDRNELSSTKGALARLVGIDHIMSSSRHNQTGLSFNS